MDFSKILILLIVNKRGKDAVPVNQIGFELKEIVSECNSWRHFLVDLMRAGYLESPRRSFYRITAEGRRFCSKICQQFECARSSRSLEQNTMQKKSVPKHATSLSESELESDISDELTEICDELKDIWHWACSDNKKLDRVIKKLLNQNEPTIDRIRIICAELWGALEEIPNKDANRFESAVEETLAVIKSKRD